MSMSRGCMCTNIPLKTLLSVLGVNWVKEN